MHLGLFLEFPQLFLIVQVGALTVLEHLAQKCALLLLECWVLFRSLSAGQPRQHLLLDVIVEVFHA